MRFNPSVTEVARNFADYINRVAFRGERFVLMRGKKPVAELRPVPVGKRLGELSALLDTLPHLSQADCEAFATELDQAHTEWSSSLPRDPWRS